MKLVILTDWILDLLDVVRSCRSDYHLLAQWRIEFTNLDIGTVIITHYLEKLPSRIFTLLKVLQESLKTLLSPFETRMLVRNIFNDSVPEFDVEPSFLNVAYILQMYSEKCSEIPHLEGLNKIIFQTNVNIEEP